jgi:predicted DNA-binding protein
MVKGKKTTEKFDKRINIRVPSSLWHKIMLISQEESLSPSAWLRSQIQKIIKNMEGEGGKSNGRKL